MPDRIVRDELLDSDRYCSLSSDTARMLFIHFLLTADDLGNAEATSRLIRTRLLPAGGSDEAITKLLSELADADLVRVYEVEGKRYVHIPRFRQRLRSIKRAHPRPPAAIECTEIKTLLSNLSDKRPSNDSQLSGTCQSLAREEKGREEKEGAAAPTSARVWDLGLELLREAGLTDRTARPFLGRLMRDYDEATLNDAFLAAAGKADPKGYVLGVLRTKPKRTDLVAAAAAAPKRRADEI